MWRNWLRENNCDGSKVLQSNHRICNAHFAKEDICLNTPEKPKLKKEAVPSIIGPQEVKTREIYANVSNSKNDNIGIHSREELGAVDENVNVDNSSFGQKCNQHEQELHEKKLQFLKILKEIDSNPESVNFPVEGLWTSNVINNEILKCIMWSMWSKDGAEIEKRILLLPDMKLLVS